MAIGIIGAGLIGKTLAKKFSIAGHQVAPADARGAESLHAFAQQGGTSGRRSRCHAEAQVLVVAVPLRSISELA